jgi:hypothetical protein
MSKKMRVLRAFLPAPVPLLMLFPRTGTVFVIEKKLKISLKWD